MANPTTAQVITALVHDHGVPAPDATRIVNSAPTTGLADLIKSLQHFGIDTHLAARIASRLGAT